MTTAWNETFESINIALVAIAGPDPTVRNQLHAATCHYEGERHIEVFNGMKCNGMSEVFETKDVMIKGAFSLTKAFLIFLARVVKKCFIYQQIKLTPFPYFMQL